MRCDILYCEGPGDIVGAFASWRRGGDFTSETSVTFSSQIFEYCAERRLSLYAVSGHSMSARVSDGRYIVENKPRWQCRLPLFGYHLSLFIYAVRLLVLALAVRPRVIFVCSGVVGWEYATLLKLSGAKIVPILHNALWPVGHRPGGPRQRLQDWVHRFFWRRCVWRTLAVSPALKQQIQEIAGVDRADPVVVFRPSFSRAFFGEPPPRTDFASRPFRVLYVGRIEENKGAFDIVAMAAALLARIPDGFRFDVCGDGSDFAELEVRVRASGLQDHIRLHGRLKRPELTQRYLEAHAVVVPTRTTFTEGFAMVVAEAMLSLKPVVSSVVVPATQTFASAVLLAKPDDVTSYVEAIERLSQDRALYEGLVDQAQQLRSSIFDERESFLEGLRTMAVPTARKPVAAAVFEDEDESFSTPD